MKSVLVSDAWSRHSQHTADILAGEGVLASELGRVAVGRETNEHTHSNADKQCPPVSVEILDVIRSANIHRHQIVATEVRPLLL